MKNLTITQNAHPVHKRRHQINPYSFNCCIFAIFTLVAVVVVTVTVTLAVSGAGEVQTPMEITSEPMVDQITMAPIMWEHEVNDIPRTPAVFYALTSEQRMLIEQVVSAESRGEPYDGQAAVAQCILNACLKDDITPEQAIKKYKYTKARVEPTESVKEAVAAVFDRGEGITDEPIVYFYNPKLCESEFHESQVFVMEIANHKFFKEEQQNAE